MPVDFAKAHDQWARFAYCRDNGHTDFVKKADRCDKFVAGDQWEQGDLDALNLAKRPAMTINKIFPTIGTILGEQIQNRVEVLLRPANGGNAEVADALSKVWMQISQANQLPWIRSDVFCDGLVRSRGFYDVRLDYTDAMEGEVRISQLNSKNVVIDPDADQYDPDAWADVFITKWMNPQDIEILYSKKDAEILQDKGASDFMYGYDSIERARDRFSGMALDAASYDAFDNKDGLRKNIRVLERQYRRLDKQEHLVDIATGDMRPIPEGWDRDRIAALLEKSAGQLTTTKKLIKRIRWCVTADSVVLHDAWSPYEHLTVVPYFPHFRYGKSVGVVENLIGPQEILNKVSSQELHIVNTTANSGWLVEENSLVNKTLDELELTGAQTGVVIEYRKGAQPPAKIAPNQVPTGLDRISMKAEEHIKSISNVSDSMMGFDRSDVAAKAIAYKQQRGAVNLTKMMDNLERTDWILARNTLSLVQSFYTEPRLIKIIHEDITRQDDEIQVNQPDPVTGAIINDLTLGEYDIVITSAPHRASLEDSQFEQARALREIGVQIPDHVLIENSRLQRRAEIVKQMQGDQESPQAQAAMARQERMEEAAVAKVEAEVQEATTQAQLNQVRAQKEMVQAQQLAEGTEEGVDPAAELELDAQKSAAELQLKQRQMEAEFAFKREQMEREFELKREALANEIQIKRETAEADAQIKQKQAEQQAVAQRVQLMRQEAQAKKTATTTSQSKKD